MADLSNIFGAATAPASSSGLSNIFGATSTPSPSSGLSNIFAAAKPAAPTAPNYWSGTVNGTSFAPSVTKDTSGKPLLDYRAPTDNATTTDQTRVDTTFNPSVATTTPASDIQNLRDPSIRGTVPGSELDHSIPLELSGSNQPANLKYQPGIQGGVAAASDKVENQLAQDVQSGKISLFDAQTQMAKQKRLKTPVTGEKSSPGLLEDVVNGGKSALDWLGGIFNKIQPIDPVKTPTIDPNATLQDNPVDYFNNLVSTFTKQTPIATPGSGLDKIFQTAPASNQQLQQSVTPIADFLNSTSKGIGQSLSPVTGDRQRNFLDIFNMLPAIVNSTGIPGAVMDLAEPVAGKPLSFDTPLFNGEKITTQGAQAYYNDAISKGVAPDTAFADAAIKTVGDLSVLIPFFRSIAKFGILKVAPETILKQTVLDTQQVRTYLQTGKPMPKPLQDAFKQLPNDQKVAVAKGLVTKITSPTPNLLGRILGVTDAEAKAILDKINQVGPTEEPKQLPGEVQKIETPAPQTLESPQKIEAPSTPTPIAPQKIEEPTSFPETFKPSAPSVPSNVQSISPPPAASPISQPGGEEIQKIAETPQPIAQEAMRYPTAEKFVKAQGEPLYHGTTDGDPTKLTFNSSIVKGNVVEETVPITIRDAQDSLKNAGYSDTEVKDIITSLADRVKSRLGKQSILPSEVKEAAFDYSTKKAFAEAPAQSKEIVPTQKSRFATGEDLIREIAKPKSGEQGLELKKVELSQLIDYLISDTNPNANLNRGIIYKPYGYNTDKIADVILGKVNVPRFGESTIVAEMLPNGKLNGRIRVHGTSLDPKKVIGRVGGTQLKALSSPTVPEAQPVPEKQITLQSTVIPGLDKFIEQDLKAAFKGTVGGVANTWDTIKKVFAPATRGPEAKLASSIKREALGRQARAKEMAYKTFEKAHKMFDKYSKEQSLAVIDGIETGHPVPGTEQFATIMHEVLNKYWAQVKEISGAESYIENYYPHMWKDPEAAVGILKKSYGKRPLEGTKSYLKQRTIPTIKEGIALGLEPESYNPVEVVMARINDMGRYIMAHDVWEQYKGQGLAKFVKFHGEIPQGWTQVEDKISKVFAPMELYNAKGEAKTVVVQTGSYYMPEQVATILKNYLAPGLQKYALYNGFRMVGNTLNQAQLGLSAFHVMFTTGDAIVSKTALEIQKVFGEKQSLPERVTALFKATISPVAGPVYVWQNIARGNKLIQDYYRENPEIPEIVDAIERAGGRVKMDHFYGTGAVQSFLKALRSGNLPGAAIRSPFALLEAISRPLMEHFVPRQKLGVFADGAKFIMDQAQKGNWSEAQTTLRLQEFWDSVDNRMGQLVYDNLEWNKILKDGLMATVRSVGWNVGDLREAMGIPQLGIEGAKAAFNLGAKATGSGKRFNARFKPKMGYVIALPYVMGIYSAIIYYLYHKKFPTNLRDLYAIPTNTFKQDGTQERIFLASYMKDVFAYTAQPLQTLKNKLHPEIATILDMLQNQDYFGTEIRNPTDPLTKQIMDLVAFQAKQFVPFSFSNANQMAKTGANPVQSYLEGFTGITPAPGYVTNSPLQIKIQNLYDLRFGGGVKSAASQAAIQQKSAIRQAYYTGDAAKANQLLQQAIKDGVIKPTGVSTFIKDADIPSDIKLFQQLPAEDQTNLLKGMELFQLNRYAWYAKNEVKAQFSSLSSNAKDWVGLYQSGAVQKPIWSKQQQTNVAK